MNDIVTENQPAHERTHAAKQADINEPSLQSATDTAAVQAILQALLHSHQFEESQIKTDSESLEHWGKDWTKHFAPAASAIVFPNSTEQVQAIVRLQTFFCFAELLGQVYYLHVWLANDGFLANLVDIGGHVLLFGAIGSH